MLPKKKRFFMNRLANKTSKPAKTKGKPGLKAKIKKTAVGKDPIEIFPEEVKELKCFKK